MPKELHPTFFVMVRQAIVKQKKLSGSASSFLAIAVVVIAVAGLCSRRGRAFVDRDRLCSLSRLTPSPAPRGVRVLHRAGSVPAIAKYIKAEWPSVKPKTFNKSLRRTLKKAVEDGALAMVKASYKLTPKERNRPKEEAKKK